MNKSDFLFAMPNFLGGISRVLDLGSTLNLYNESESAEKADYRAIASDWKITGDDLRRALNEQRKHRGKS